jgi:hypothetical protein
MQEGRQTGRRPRAAVRRFVSLRLPPPFARLSPPPHASQLSPQAASSTQRSRLLWSAYIPVENRVRASSPGRLTRVLAPSGSRADAQTPFFLTPLARHRLRLVPSGQPIKPLSSQF